MESSGLNCGESFHENSVEHGASSSSTKLPSSGKCAVKNSSSHRLSSDLACSTITSRDQHFQVFEEESQPDEEESEREENVKVYQLLPSPPYNTRHKPQPAGRPITKPKSGSGRNANKVSTTVISDFDEFSGLASDLPSDLFDIEGNLLVGNLDHIKFGVEDDDFSSADDDAGNHHLGHHHHQSDNDVRCPTDAKSLKRKRIPKGVLSASWRKSGSSPCQRRHHYQQQPPESVHKRRHQYPSLSSSKFIPIVDSCDMPPQLKSTVTPSDISCRGDGVVTPGEDSDRIGMEVADATAKTARTVRRTLRKHSSEDLYHPLINMSKNRYPKRQYSPSHHTSSGTHNNSSSGNFSPPSDHFRSPLAPFDRHHSSGGTSSTSSTITQHYYPEGGWGYVVLVTCTICHVLTCGLQLSFGILWHPILEKFGGSDMQFLSCWLGAVSLGISLLFSPVWVSICKKKSTRLSAVFGGLVASLGCLFTSFASQFHQTFISYGAFLGIGVGLSRDASSLMVGQYFKRKRELVEIIVVSGSGLGIIIMSISIHSAIGSLGWRLGLQAVTVSLILTFFLGTCYRSASLYHPQRRAILHLKNQKRKVKEKGKREDKPPFIDASCLRSKTLRIILMSSACTAFGIFTPLLSLAVQCSKKGFEDCSVLLLHIYVGTSWVIGCCTLGLIVIQKSQDCRVSKQYLCQVASLMCAISILALTAVKGTNGMLVFSWVYGASLGGYCYSLKVYTYERARARHFPRAWSFLQSSQAIPLFFGVPLTNYANETVGWKSGYYLSALAVFVGTACLFLTDVRRRKLSRRKSQNSSMKTCETTDGGTSSPKSKRLSFAFPVEQLAQQQSKHDSDDEDEPGGPDPVMIKELTCISEEGLADLDFQDIYFDDWAEYIGECITSCNKVENCLVSEYDPDLAMIVERRARRWSAAKQTVVQHPTQGSSLMSTATKGRLALPGIGTVLEVPLLVAKRLHPNLGSRSQKYKHHLGHPTARHDDDGGSYWASNSASSECNFARGGSCAATGSRGCADAAPSTSRGYHGKCRGSHTVSQFPAIDEDSV